MGIAFALMASFLWGVSAVLVSRATERANPVYVSFVSLTPAPLLLLAATVVAGESSGLLSLRPAHLLFLGLAGILNFVLGRTFSFLAIRHIGPSRASTLGASAILVGPLSAFVLLRETVDAKTALGILAIFLGVLLVSSERR